MDVATIPVVLGAAQANRDPLAEVLRLVEMSGVFYCPSRLTEPWGASLPPTADCVWFHVLTSGTCTIITPGGTTVEMAVGDLVVLPHGTGHVAHGAEPADTPSVLDLPHDHVGDRFAVLRHGGGGDPTNLVCGGVRLDHPAAARLLTVLPEILHVRVSDRKRADWMRATLDLIADETSEIGPGGDAIVSRLCDILVMQAIRTWIDEDPAARSGWIGALRDEHLGRAIEAVHREPGRRWTVATLAEVAHMSRSAFAARFQHLVGHSVMEYVTEWRMTVAERMIRAEGCSVAAAAEAVGYESESSFARAFRRVTGRSPGGRRAG